ncbi:MAG: substrate-binding domain-containing protein [Hyphomonadaceae bacterium]
MDIKSTALCLASVIMLAACGGSDSGNAAPAPDAQADAGSASHAPATATQSGDVRIVGSSTVYPFSTKVAQEFKNKTGFNVVVESTGSGGGHKLFCSGTGEGTPDVTNSSRRQKSSELENCIENGVDEVVEVKIGFDGIVLANSIDSDPLDLSLREIYLAFAKQVPMSDADCTLQDNPYDLWSDIRAGLPQTRIEAYGPPPTSGTRDAFVEIAMEGGADEIACLAELHDSDKSAFTVVAHTLREDGNWIDAGENDNAVVQTLTNTPTAIGVFGYSFLDQNADIVRGAHVSGVEPSFENIAGGQYAISRSLYFYLKPAHVALTEGLKEYALEFTSEEAWGPGGYLEEIGLVPLPDADRAAYRAAVETMTAYQQ